MPCHYPLPAWRRPGGQVVVAARAENHLAEPSQLDALSRKMLLPCGSCLGCRTSQALAWALRGMLELHEHPSAVFSTLTFDDAHVPRTLSTRTLQLFIKRVRKGRRSGSIRHLSCGEYGERFGRPHYHSILYGASVADSRRIQNAWPCGTAHTVNCTPATIAYTAGYTTKKLADFPPEDHEQVDYETGEIYKWKAPFLQMSRNPGIGSSARQFISSWRSFAILNGRTIPVPRYLHLAWQKAATPEQREELKREQQQLHDLKKITLEHLEATRLMADAQQELKASRRKL